MSTAGNDHALLALGGTLPGAARLVELASEHPRVVAADGAALELRAAGIHVDVVIGDLDSIGDARAELEAAGATIVEEPSQDSGDFEKALVWLEESGVTRVTIVGFDGGLLDHALNNASILARHARRLAIQILAGDGVATCVVDRLELPTTPGDRVSLIPLPSARVTATGLEWSLLDETLSVGVREGGSNRAAGSLASIAVSDGVLLVVHFPGVAS